MQALRAIQGGGGSTANFARAQSIVESIGSIRLQGNILPSSWFQQPQFKNPTGRVNLAAAVILSDVVYWYRPQEIRDEATGKVIELRRKFKADKLQKSYQAWADQFGLTKRQVKDAVVFLRNQGLITTEFRQIRTETGLVLSNVLFVEPVVDELRSITFDWNH
jgi:hypothetical protein